MKTEFDNPTEEQKELIRYWIEKLFKFYNNSESFPSYEGMGTNFIEKHLSPKPKIEVGRAYKYPDIDGWMIFISKIDADGFAHGYGFDCNCSWMQDWNQGTTSELETLIECTKEFEDRLIEEAKRRGYVNGTKFIQPHRPKINLFESSKGVCSNTFYYCKYENSEVVLLSGGHAVMVDGKWAEIIDDKAHVKEKIQNLKKEIDELEKLI